MCHKASPVSCVRADQNCAAFAASFLTQAMCPACHAHAAGCAAVPRGVLLGGGRQQARPPGGLRLHHTAAHLQVQLSRWLSC
jgi:hypothetical protein